MNNTKVIYIVLILIISQTSYLISDEIDSLKNIEFEDKESIEYVEHSLNLSKLFRETNHKLSLEYAKKGLEIARDLENDSLIYKSYKKIALSYKSKGDLDNALEYFLMAIDIAKEMTRSDYITITYNNIAVLYIRYDQNKRALNYLNKAHELAIDNQDTLSISNILNNKGVVHWNNEEYDRSFANIRESMLLSLALGDSSGLISSYNNLGLLQTKMGDTIRALGYYNQAARLSEQKGDLWNYANILNNRAKLLLEFKRVDQVEKDLKTAIEISKQINSKLLESDSYLLQSIYYEKVGNYDSALIAHKLYSKLKMEVINTETSNKIAGIEKDFEIKSKNRHLQKLSEANQIQYYLILLLGGSLVLLGVFIFIAFRKSKRNKQLANELTKRNNELEKLSEEKSKYFTLISHDLKAPLYNISNLSGLVKNYKNDMSESEYNNTLDLLDGSSKQVIELIDNILTWAKTQTDNIEIEKSEFYIDDMVHSCIKILEPMAKEKNITIKYEEQYFTVTADKKLISTATRNLISNAIKFSDADSQIVIDCSENNEGWAVSVKDEGVGMTQTQIENILRGKSATTLGTKKEKGSGLGLLITKGFIELTEGELEIISEIGKGSNFIIKLKK